MRVVDAHALLDELPDAEAVPIEAARDMYRTLIRARAFDQKLIELGEAREPIIHHPGLGQEAPTVATCANLTENDTVMPYHRGFTWAVARGLDLGRVVAELYGKATGYNRGRSGPHFADWDTGSLGRSGIQGAHLQMAAGVGLALRLEGTGRVCLAYCGDGATNTGAFHEGLNIAAAWSSAVVYIVENNGYQFATPADEVMKVRRISDRAVGYGMPGVTVDGNDPLSIYQAAREAVARARAGDGPSLIECITYRWSNEYYLPDRINSDSRSTEEIQEWRDLDAIERLRVHLADLDALSPNEEASILRNARLEMDEAVSFAMESPYPTRDELIEGIYV